MALEAAQPEGAAMGGDARSEEEVARAKAVGSDARKRRLDELYQETVAEYEALASRVCVRPEGQ